MKSEQLKEIRIAPEERRRRSRPFLWILAVILVPTGVALYMAARGADAERTIGDAGDLQTAAPTSAPLLQPPDSSQRPGNDTSAEPVLTVSGYIINAERIELSPRNLGVVKWLGVKKGDHVNEGDLLVTLDDSEEQARLLEAQGRLAVAAATVDQVLTKLERARVLLGKRVGSQEDVDNLERDLAVAKARVEEAKGAVQLAETYLSWTIFRSPIDGVVLEKLVDENELVSPQSFGGDRSPSTALVALADPSDLQVEIDLNERDLAKVQLGHQCRVSPEAYPERSYAGYVAEMAPEASRQKGTLEVKVQIENPDDYLTPNLTARVEFLPGETGSDRDGASNRPEAPVKASGPRTR